MLRGACLQPTCPERPQPAVAIAERNLNELRQSLILAVQVKVQNSPMYTIGARLGKGGYGFVYRGVRTQANRKSFRDKPLNVSGSKLLGSQT